MNRISKMEYPHGWGEDCLYDSIGQLLEVTDTDPSNNDMKQQKHTYTYDDCGNMTYEYIRGNGTGEATVENTCTYDAEFFNEIAPPSYEKTIIKNRVREHIFKSAGMSEETMKQSRNI